MESTVGNDVEIHVPAAVVLGVDQVEATSKACPLAEYTGVLVLLGHVSNVSHRKRTYKYLFIVDDHVHSAI